MEGLLASTHLVVPDDLPALITQHAADLGARAATLYLADLEQRWLVPVVSPKADIELAAEAIDGTLGGRSFRSMDVLEASDEDGGLLLWVPVVDGTERLGVLQYRLGGREYDVEHIKAFTGLVAELVMTKSSYGDYFELAKRREPLSVAAELLWQLLPPLTFATEELVIAGGMIPVFDLGGDAFDYGVDQDRAAVAIFDGLGHGLDAGLLATAAVAAYRNSRRRRLDLADTAAHIGNTIEEHFDTTRFVTGILATLDLHSGRFAWTTAGHPAPLLVRQHRVVKHLDPDNGLPFGVGPASDVFEEQLEPGDRILLYTDGVTEARTANGEPFELDVLVDLLTRTAGDDPPPEAMRRLMHAIEAHNHGPMRDDATAVMIEWRGAGPEAVQV